MIRIKREEKIVIRCTAREKEVIKNLANEKGLEVSNFIRYLIEQYKKENQLLEIWKDIKGYEGIYQVSNTGRIRSLLFNKQKT